MATTRVSGGSTTLPYRQVIQPSFRRGSLTSTQTSIDLLMDTRGKKSIGINIANPSNKTVTVTVYGAQFSTSQVGDDDVRTLDGTPFTVGTSAGDYQVAADPFPWYIIRLATTAAPSVPVVAHINAMS